MDDLTARLGAVEPGLARVRGVLRANAAGRMLVGGLALWVIAVVVTLATDNANLLPTIILLGGFLVPVTYLTWAYHRTDAGELTLPTLVKAFMAGGILGVLAASVLEAYFLAPSPFLYVGVALAEELVKVAALAYVARQLRGRSLRNGMVLGAALGFGFGAFQSVGYGLNAVFTVTGLSLRGVVETELLRSALAPVGHGLWTAILGGVLFAAAKNGRWRVTAAVFFSYLGVSLLQALWDATHNVAVVFTLLLTDTPWQLRLLGLGYLPRPTDVQIHFFTVATFVGYVLLAAVGLLWLGVLRRKLDQVDAESAASSTPSAPPPSSTATTSAPAGDPAHSAVPTTESESTTTSS